MPSTQSLSIEPLSAAAFAPYGHMLGDAMQWSEPAAVFSNPATDFWRTHLFQPGAAGDTEILWVNYRSRDLVVSTLEVHHLTQQAIVPLTGAVVHVVACSNAQGLPDLDTLKAFLIPQGLGICMQPGCWHASRVLGEQVTCLMLTRRSTTLDLVAHLNGTSAAQESAFSNISALIVTG
ncbi:ureidoglycolate hydrolase [Lampropedia aestuarii]|uniref:Ureidoglycolate hydrolase n=1 Tax=Lampropedia aestuarii TaxID=2562762 RepID=A0A4S5BRZ9_9BURK|nr:ureidoglycolate lyase [Lampropedia aestuarii]THJ35567.1 ureidoglycolate hydrolase [Lampropedia aestuarii]